MDSKNLLVPPDVTVSTTPESSRASKSFLCLTDERFHTLTKHLTIELHKRLSKIVARISRTTDVNWPTELAVFFASFVHQQLMVFDQYLTNENRKEVFMSHFFTCLMLFLRSGNPILYTYGKEALKKCLEEVDRCVVSVEEPIIDQGPLGE